MTDTVERSASERIASHVVSDAELAKVTYLAAAEDEAAGRAITDDEARNVADAMRILGYSTDDFKKHVAMLQRRDTLKRSLEAAKEQSAAWEAKLPRADEIEERAPREIREAREIRSRWNAASSTEGQTIAAYSAALQDIKAVFG